VELLLQLSDALIEVGVSLGLPLLAQLSPRFARGGDVGRTRGVAVRGGR